MQAHRLDATKTPMAAAVEWFVAKAGDGELDLSNVLVATPGARAGRVLSTLLARACQDRGLVLTPPDLTTAGKLAEAMAPAARPAGDLQRRLAWARVLRDAPEDLIAPVLPESAEPEAWALEISRSLDELARGGLRCRDVARSELPPLEDPQRWHALASMQGEYEALLGRAGLVDPTLHAIDAGSDVAAGLREIVLLACMDLTPLARRMLREAPCPVHALVMLDEGLDDDGVVLEDFWRDADIDVEPEDVFVTEGAEAQGSLAVRAAVDLETSAIGTADESLAGAVRRAADGHGLSVHVAWGPSASASGPARLLADLALLLRERSFIALARVLTNPIVVSTLAREEHRFDQLPRAVDDYAGAALPTKAFAKLPEGTPRVARPRRIVMHAQARLKSMLGPLRGKPRPLREWAHELGQVLTKLLAPSQDLLGPASLDAIAAIGEQVRGLAALPEALDAEAVSAHQAISLVLGQLDQRGAPAEPGGEDVDLLGWLELPLDPSPAMVVMGVHHSTLPAAAMPGPLVTEGLRRALGLPGEDRTLARDAANMAALVGGGRRVRFVLGSADAKGEPLLPSTLLLRGSGDGPARVLGRVRARFETHPAREAPPACGYRVGVMRDASPITSMAVTSFRTFLESPYQFYLRYALGLRDVEPMPGVPRLEANAFGTLLHEALARFGGDVASREIEDEGEIRRLMHAALWESTERLAGRRPSAITLAQIDAAEHRLAAFARVEAAWRREGWRTVEVEWTPEMRPPLGKTGIGLSGAIDRIDFDANTGRLALFDYKTSNEARQPAAAHRGRDGAWRDLQLPLYEILARPLALEHGVEQIPALGYVSLSARDARVLEAGWDEADLADAHACAIDVATRIRSGIEAMADLGSPRFDGPHARLAGLGMLLDPEHLADRAGVAP
ncbi:MAG: PD-(D/E)XK nuclease family protein [Phycisphaerales bacterium]|jgi:ATP-dependent helicase/nuclease subunit B